MPAPTTSRSSARALVLSPQEQLIAGGAAEELERQIQATLRSGVQHVIVDLRHVPVVDSAGIRALIRGHTSAQRLGRRLTICGPNARVRQEIGLLGLQDVLQICDTLQEAKATPLPWRRVLTFVAVGAIGFGLVIVGITWPTLGLRPLSVPVDAGTSLLGPIR